MSHTIPLMVTRTQWAAGQGFFHTCVLHSNGKPFVYVFDCGSKNNADTGSPETISRINQEVDEFATSLNRYWIAEPTDLWRLRQHWQEWLEWLDWQRPNSYLDYLLYKYPFESQCRFGATFIGTPFTKGETIPLNPAQQGKKPIIDIVYISHFDADHINGLKYLLNKTVIKEVSIPCTTPAERFIYLLNSTSNEYGQLEPVDLLNISDFTLQFVANPHAALAQQAGEITLSQLENGDNESNLSIHATHNPSTDGYDLNSASPTLSPNKTIWTLFTHTLKGNARKLEQSFNAALIDEIRKVETRKHKGGATTENPEAANDTEPSRTDFQNKETNDSDKIDFTDYTLLRKLLSREYIDAIRNAYRKALSLSKGLNETSLILYSGPDDERKIISTFHSCWRGNKTLHKFPSASTPDLAYTSPACGWIGCGDAPLGQNPQYITEFNRVFEYYKTKTRTFAPPHHGSEIDWSDELLEDFGPNGEEAPICVFSANSIRWKHPSTRVILSTNSIGSPTIVVTNDVRSRFTETIELIVRFD